MRPKAEIYTPKGDDEYPHPFHMRVSPREWRLFLIEEWLPYGFVASHIYEELFEVFNKGESSYVYYATVKKIQAGSFFKIE